MFSVELSPIIAALSRVVASAVEFLSPLGLIGAYGVIALAIASLLAVGIICEFLCNTILLKVDARFRRKFTARGFTYETYYYARRLAFGLFAIALVFVFWKPWHLLPHLLVAAAVLTLVMSVLGWFARSTGDLRRFFAIFYAPTGYLATSLFALQKVLEATWPRLVDPGAVAFLW
jgi:hypothetical protein